MDSTFSMELFLAYLDIQGLYAFDDFMLWGVLRNKFELQNLQMQVTQKLTKQSLPFQRETLLL